MATKAKVISEKQKSEEERYKNYIKKLRSEFGDDFKFIFPIWHEAIEATIEFEEIGDKDLIIGCCDDYDKIIIHAICFANTEDQAQLIKILITRISKRLDIPIETPIKIKGEFFIVY